MTPNYFPNDQDYLTKTTQEMAIINSINPSLIPAGKGEAEIGAHLVA